MPRYLLPWLVACIAATLGVVQGLAASAADRPLRWGADSEGGAPYIFLDPERPDQTQGFEVDLAAALADELGQPIEFTQYAYESLLQGLERGDLDFVMNGLEVTPDRQAKVRFSRPYYLYQLQLAVRAEETRFATLAECRAQQRMVGTLGETAASRLLEETGVPARLYDSQAEPYVDLELGRIDAVLMDLPIAVYYGRPRPGVKLVGEPFARGEYAIAFRKADEALAARVNAALERLAVAGTLRVIYEKWGIWNPLQEQLGDLDPGSEQAPANAIVPPAVAGAGKYSFRNYFPLLCHAAWMTIQISVLSMALAMALGLLVAVVRLYAPWPAQWLALAYVEFFRGIPVLLLLYFLYYALPTLLAPWIGQAYLPNAFQVALLAFGLNYAAYEAEIYRAGLLSIPAGQWEAAASLGMSRWLTFRRIILPQALRTILPPVTNDFVALFKDTSVVSVIAVVELTKQYQMLSKSSLKYLEIGLATALLYLVMSVPLGYLARTLEARWGKGLA